MDKKTDLKIEIDEKVSDGIGLKDFLNSLKDEGKIDFSIQRKRKCDFCNASIDEESDFESIRVGDDDYLDKCESCKNG